MSFDFTSRYEALGIQPNPEITCKGQCDGIGRYPQSISDGTMTKYEREQWNICHQNTHRWCTVFRELILHPEWWFWKSIIKDLLSGEYFKCDGWHFIVCGECNGTGKIQ
jgi:hypothetical protein